MIRELTFFGLTVGSYFLMAVIAALVFVAMSWRPLRRCGFTRKGVLLLLFVMCIAFLAGARLWNVAVNPGAYGETKHWYTLRLTGLSMYGGILGAFAVLLCFSKIRHIKTGALLDAITVPSAVAFCIARIGCFLNGCCSGKRTDLPWGVVFPLPIDDFVLSLISIERYPVHPTQIYELLLALIGIPLCILLVKKCRAGKGGLFFIYGAWFSAMRLAVLPLRSLNYPDVVKKIIYPAIYLILVAAGIFLFVRACRQRSNSNTEVSV